jgi:hypothetical protein
MRYFTTEFLMSPSPGWEVNCWGDNWQHWEDTVVKHLETGHIWKLTGEREPWGDTLIWPGRWPD